MICKFEQIQFIVKENPNKAKLIKAREMAEKLMLHVDGTGMEKAIKHCDHFANAEVYKVQKQYAVSNVDMMQRVLQQEDMIFMARGGSSHFRLPDTDEAYMNIVLSEIEFGMNLRKWIQVFARSAYRTDPMGIIFMEVDALKVDERGVMNNARAYPTYKSSTCIHDYESTGRHLEYVCFKLTVKECLSFGIVDEKLKGKSSDAETNYFRFVDDAKDLIVYLEDGVVSLVTSGVISQKNPLPNNWNKTPGFIVSDIINYKDPSIFLSPIQPIVELADTFLQDRSIRDLQKKFHGFAKAIEPLLACSTCLGSKYIDGQNCPDCTPKGGEPTGFKFKTKISDVARFPLDILEKGSFDFNKIFGYVTPDVKSWDKQDASLDDIEQFCELTHWGTVRIKRPKAGSAGPNGEAITATEVDSNEAPKIARLNQCADWAESTETMVANFMGQFWFGERFKGASISYGRDWILKTPEELMAQYQTLVGKGAPDFSKDEALEKYYQAKYATNQIQLQKFLKMLNVEPFPHDTVANVESSSVVSFDDKLAKRYCGEWIDTVPEIDWLRKTAKDLKAGLMLYVKAKGITEPKKEVVPGVGAAQSN